MTSVVRLIVEGESNADYHVDQYQCSFSRLISHWRQIWNDRTGGITDIQFPFGFVQVCFRTQNNGNLFLFIYS